MNGAHGLFTLGVSADMYRLPHPKLDLTVILLVRRVILRAFEMIAADRFSLATKQEDEITTALRARIENVLRQDGSIPGFNRGTFETVTRQGEVVNFDMTKFRKTPDLFFKLRNDEEEPRPVLSEHDGLFVECKPIDRNHAAGTRYCDDGLCRFIDGDYAWAMEQAMMVGYVRHGRTIEHHLIPAMKEPRRRVRLKVVDLPCVLKVQAPHTSNKCHALQASKHQRGFPWPDGKGIATDIIVYHSWHDCE